MEEQQLELLASTLRKACSSDSTVRHESEKELQSFCNHSDFLPSLVKLVLLLPPHSPEAKLANILLRQQMSTRIEQNTVLGNAQLMQLVTCVLDNLSMKSALLAWLVVRVEFNVLCGILVRLLNQNRDSSVWLSLACCTEVSLDLQHRNVDIVLEQLTPLVMLTLKKFDENKTHYNNSVTLEVVRVGIRLFSALRKSAEEELNTTLLAAWKELIIYLKRKQQQNNTIHDSLQETGDLCFYSEVYRLCFVMIQCGVYFEVDVVPMLEYICNHGLLHTEYNTIQYDQNTGDPSSLELLCYYAVEILISKHNIQCNKTQGAVQLQATDALLTVVVGVCEMTVQCLETFENDPNEYVARLEDVEYCIMLRRQSCVDLLYCILDTQSNHRLFQSALDQRLTTQQNTIQLEAVLWLVAHTIEVVELSPALYNRLLQKIIQHDTPWLLAPLIWMWSTPVGFNYGIQYNTVASPLVCFNILQDINCSQVLRLLSCRVVARIATHHTIQHLVLQQPENTFIATILHTTTQSNIDTAHMCLEALEVLLTKHKQLFPSQVISALCDVLIKLWIHADSFIADLIVELYRIVLQIDASRATSVLSCSKHDVPELYEVVLGDFNSGPSASS